MAEMAAEGLGLAMLPCCLGDRSRGLRRASAIAETVETGLWVACHPDMIETPRIQAAMGYLTGALTRFAPVLEGTGAAEPVPV